MQTKHHNIRTFAAYTLLFTAIGTITWLLLGNYPTDNARVMERINSPGFGASMILVFWALGFITVRLSNWLTALYQLKAHNKWLIVSAYIGIMLLYLVINYGFLVVAKMLAGLPNPFVFEASNAPGLRLIFIIWCMDIGMLGVLLANRSTEQVLRYQRKMALLQEENMNARYIALQNQLNPHFLFNSFNTLISEIDYDQQRAIRFTRCLSDVYRYVLEVQTKRLVSLQEELDFARSYLYLHQVRLGDCVSCGIDIPYNYLAASLPPLSLQVLLENVFKHNYVTETDPMTITIAIDKETNRLVCSNIIHKRQSVDSTGVGLENLSSRCKMTIGHDIEIQSDETLFTVKIPLLL